MVKSLTLFLSFLLTGLFALSQNTGEKNMLIDCFSKKVQDSLLEKYIDSSAENYGYNSPQWQLYCDSLIHICPNIASVYQLKALPFIKYGEYEKAFALEDKAVELDPERYTAYRGFLKCIFTKDYENAIIDFQKAQQLTPNSYEMDHTFFFYEGLCNLELGNYIRAEENMKRDIFIQTGNDQSKSAHFNSWFYLGVLYYEMGNYPAAREALLKCTAQYMQHSNANYYIAMSYRAEKNEALAKEYLQISKRSFEQGYGINEGNIYYVNYPHLIRMYELEQALADKK